jgi:hypothetical protein
MALCPGHNKFKGVGSATASLQSACVISWHDEEGCSGTFLLYVQKELPANLLGRDVLEEMGAILYSPRAKISNMILQQGFDPCKGLRKSQQGMRDPISSMPCPPRMRLGYETSHTHF